MNVGCVFLRLTNGSVKFLSRSNVYKIVSGFSGVNGSFMFWFRGVPGGSFEKDDPCNEPYV